tara:strand:- start:865 stop:1434 length:570 start_codon:yes stop_codon:yes gene_type:complete
MSLILSSLRTVIVSMLICVVGYALLILGAAQLLNPAGAQGSLVRAADGHFVGSSQIAQAFTAPRYFWPRPSAVDYAADAAGGSNKSPTSSDLTDRSGEIVARYGATAARPLPADLATASGAGLDPHISEAGALYQVPRVAAARGVEPDAVRTLVARLAYSPGGPFTDIRIVNVLALNLALDTAEPAADP